MTEAAEAPGERRCICCRGAKLRLTGGLSLRRAVHSTAEVFASAKALDFGAARCGNKVDQATRGWNGLTELQSTEVLPTFRVADDYPGRSAELIEMTSLDHAASDWPVAELGRRPADIQPPLLEGSDDVPPELEGPKLLLEVVVEPKATPDPRRQAQRLQMPETPAQQRRPGVAVTDAVVDFEVEVRRGQQPAIETGEPISERLSPDPPLGVGSRKVAEKFLRNFLRPGTEAIADIGSRHHQVPT